MSEFTTGDRYVDALNNKVHTAVANYVFDVYEAEITPEGLEDILNFAMAGIAAAMADASDFAALVKGFETADEADKPSKTLALNLMVEALASRPPISDFLVRAIDRELVRREADGVLDGGGF